MSRFDGVEGLDSSSCLKLEGVARGDTERPLQTADPQWTLSIGRGQSQPPLEYRPESSDNNLIDDSITLGI